MPSEIRVYEPDNAVKKGNFSIFFSILREIYSNRWFIFRFCRRDFIAMYCRSFTGIIWSFFLPLLAAGTFFVLNKSGVFNMGSIVVPYALYAFFGLIYWQVFSNGMAAAALSLAKAGPMAFEVNFSKKSLVISSLGQAVTAFLVQCAFFLTLCVYYGYNPGWRLLTLPLFLLPLLVFTLSLGLLFALLKGVARETGNITGILVSFLLFLTPVLYAKPEHGLLAAVTAYNPLYYFVSVPRDYIFYGSVDGFACYWIITVFTAVFFAVSVTAFHFTESRIAERI